jgi:hypothetical protein
MPRPSAIPPNSVGRSPNPLPAVIVGLAGLHRLGRPPFDAESQENEKLARTILEQLVLKGRAEVLEAGDRSTVRGPDVGPAPGEGHAEILGDALRGRRPRQWHAGPFEMLAR